MNSNANVQNNTERQYDISCKECKMEFKVFGIVKNYHGRLRNHSVDCVLLTCMIDCEDISCPRCLCKSLSIINKESGL